MFDLILLRKKHGCQAIPDIRNAKLPAEFRGFPFLQTEKCQAGCSACAEICPTRAITADPPSLDLGSCIFCGDCARACPGHAISFTSAHRLASTSRERLVVSGINADQYARAAIEVRREIARLFGRSLKLRQVSAGGCNGCEMELNAANNVNFDMGRFGIDFVASPRHADGLVITGPVSANMAPALMDAWKSVPYPSVVIAVGACAISGGIFADSGQLNREFFHVIQPDLFIPGCPPHPLTFIQGLLDFLGK